MMNNDVTIDPWGSSQSTDYSGIIDKFGLSSMESVTVPNPSKLHRRGVIFAHRDLDVVLESKRKTEPFVPINPKPHNPNQKPTSPR